MPCLKSLNIISCCIKPNIGVIWQKASIFIPGTYIHVGSIGREDKWDKPNDFLHLYEDITASAIRCVYLTGDIRKNPFTIESVIQTCRQSTANNTWSSIEIACMFDFSSKWNSFEWKRYKSWELKARRCQSDSIEANADLNTLAGRNGCARAQVRQGFPVEEMSHIWRHGAHAPSHCNWYCRSYGCVLPPYLTCHEIDANFLFLFQCIIPIHPFIDCLRKSSDLFSNPVMEFSNSIKRPYLIHCVIRWMVQSCWL